MNIRPAHQRDGRWRIHAAKTVFNSSAKSLENIFVFLLPLIATNILQNLSGTINTIFVGQMMVVDAIAAVSVFSPFCFTACVYYRHFNGYYCFSGQAWARRILKSSKCGGLYSVYDHHWRYHYRNHWCVFAHDILELLGTDPKVMHLSLPYVQWMLAGSPLLFVYIIYTSILRGVGDSTTFTCTGFNQCDWFGHYPDIA